MIDLGGLSVLVTRPDPEGSELCEMIENHGGYAYHLPTIDIAPPSDMTAFSEAIKKLGEVEWLIFISPQSVYASVPAIRRAWPEFPEQVKFASVGPGTAKALHQAGYLVAIHPSTEWNSEGLLNLPVFNEVKGKKIAIIRGEGGREKIDQVLSKRGAKLLQVIAYRRILPKVHVKEPLQLCQQGKIDVIISTSFESVKNLKILLGNEGWPYIQKIPLLVISERIKGLAHDLGFKTIWVTHKACHQAILKTLAQNRKET